MIRRATSSDAAATTKQYLRAPTPALTATKGNVSTDRRACSALSLDEHTPGIVSVYEGESVTVTYIDQARANGARNVEIVSRIQAGPSVMVGK